VLADGPTAYWRLGETSGTVAADAAGTYSGTYSATSGLGRTGALEPTGDLDTSVQFTGVQNVNVPSQPALHPSDQTVEMWVRLEGAYGLNVLWSTRYQGGGGANEWATIDGSNYTVSYRMRSSSYVLTSTTVLQVRTWYHLAFTRSGGSSGTMKLYVNGVLEGSRSYSDLEVGSNTRPFRIGYPEEAWGDIYALLDARIDEAALYSSALTQTRIQAHYGAGTDAATAANCTDIAGATASTYTVAGADVSKRLRAVVTASNPGGTTSAGSEAKLVTSNAPQNTSPPTITGVAAQGRSLTASPGTWGGATPMTYAYQWKRCANSYSASVLADTPVAYWRLGDKNGNVATDVLGASPGTYGGSPLPTLDVPGALSGDNDRAVDFTHPQYVEIPSSPALHPDSQTVEMWVKPNDPMTNYSWGTRYEAGGGQNEWGAIDGTTRKVSYRMRGGSYVITGTTALQNGTWYHLAFTRASAPDGTFKIYVNGALEASGSYEMLQTSNNTRPLRLAYPEEIEPGIFAYSGTIDEIALYPSALPQNRLQAHRTAAISPSSCSAISGATASSYTVASADIGSQLLVSVTATNADGSSSADSARTAEVTGPAPTLDSPNNDAGVRTLTPVLTVVPSETPNTSDYQFQIAQNAAFTLGVRSSTWLTTTNTFTVPTGWLSDNTTYYWRARRHTAAGALSDWSTVRSFVVRVNRFGLRDYWPIWNYGPIAVNQATGNLILSLPTPSYPTAVDAMSFNLTYNSLDTSNAGGFGAGWTFGHSPAEFYDHDVLSGPEEMNAAEIVHDDGSSEFHSETGESDEYDAPPGEESELEENADDTYTYYDAEEEAIFGFGEPDASGEADLLYAEYIETDVGKGRLNYTYTNGKLTKIADASGRELTFTWNSLNAGGCSNAIVCVKGPDNVTWRYIGDGTGGTTGRVARVNNGTRDLLALTYDANGRIIKIQNANDLNPAAASPGYNGQHALTLAYDASGRVASVSDGPVSNQTRRPRPGRSATSPVLSRRRRRKPPMARCPQERHGRRTAMRPSPRPGAGRSASTTTTSTIQLRPSTRSETSPALLTTPATSSSGRRTRTATRPTTSGAASTTSRSRSQARTRTGQARKGVRLRGTGMTSWRSERPTPPAPLCTVFKPPTSTTSR
jgi:hypothetical protein